MQDHNDPEKPATLYGKVVFSLAGDFPGFENGLPSRWSNQAVLDGGMENEDIKKQLEVERAKAKVAADQMLKEAEEKDDANMALEATRLRQSAQTGVKTMPLTKAGREMIHEVVAPFLMRIWGKITRDKDVRDDGNYVSNMRVDGFEIGPPREYAPDFDDGGKRTAHSIMGVPLEQHLRLFKALQLLDIEAKE